MVGRRALLLAGAALPVSAYAQCVTNTPAVDACRGGMRVTSVAVPVPSLALDFTVPGTLPPNVVFTRASVGTYFDSTGTMQSATTNTPRWDYDPSTLALRGVLIEEARTNSVKNSTMVGAVAGSPGTDPTGGWSFSQAATGLTRQIAGVGVENGIAYIDVRYTAPSTAAGNVIIGFTTSGVAGVPAAAAQQWMLSYNITLSAGALPPNTGALFRCNQFDSGGTLLGTLNTNGALPIVQPLGRSRVVSNFAVTVANTAFLAPFWLFAVAASASPVDFTVRIGAPQFELGTFATSFIPTTAAAVTRAGEAVTMPVAAWFSAAASSLLAEYMLPQSPNPSPNVRDVVCLSDNTISNRMALRGQGQGATASQPSLLTSVAGTTTSSPGLGTSAAFVVQKIAGAWDGTNAVGAFNGGAAVSYAVGMASGITQLQFGNDTTASATFLDGWLRRASYWNTALSNAQLQAVTT